MLCAFLCRANATFVCSEAFQDMVANITGTDGDGPIRVFIHKVGTRLVLLPKFHVSFALMWTGVSLDRNSRRSQGNGREQEQVSLLTPTTAALFRIFVVGRSYAQFCKKNAFTPDVDLSLL